MQLTIGPKGGRRTQVLWNTPAPFNLALATASPWAYNLCARLYAIEVGKIEGLTFFLHKGDIKAIHIHHRGARSSAMSTFHRMCRLFQREADWIYVPFHESDRLQRFAIRHYNRGSKVILLGTEMAGDVIFGVPGASVGETRTACSENSLTLVYGDHKDDSSAVPFFGVLDNERPDSPQPIPDVPGVEWPHPVSRSLDMRRRIRDANVTSAPLADVVSLTVFYIGETENVRGIMLTYANSGPRTVGQCRIQVDRCRTFERPEGLCF